MANVSLTQKMEVPKVSEAYTAAQVADELYNDFCEKFPADYEGQNILRDIANAADRRLSLAREIALNECYCRDDRGAVCPVCASHQQQKYGDLIPFGGE